MSDAEVITIMILFHLSGYKCFKHFYTEYIAKHMTDLFPNVVSYNRFTELERKVVVPFILDQLRRQHCIEGMQEPEDPYA